MNKDQIKDLYLRYKIIIFPLLSGVAALVIIVFVLIPHLLSYLDLKKKISGVEENISILEAKAQELESIDSFSSKQHLQTVFTILPSDQDVPGAMSVLQDLIQKAGLRLISTAYLSSANTGNKGQKSSFSLNVNLAGSLPSIKNLMISLQNSARIFQVQAISVHFQKGTGQIEAEIPLLVYFEPSSPTLSLSNQPLPKLSNSEVELLTRLSAVVSASSQKIVESSSSAVILGKSDPFE